MRIAYVSHVDSRWIKQRPHFMAESMHHLGESVTYVCSSMVRKRSLVRSQKLIVPVLRIPMLPQRLRRSLGLFDPLLSLICALIIVIRLRPQAAFFTHSRNRRLASLLRIAGVRIFYDCMDLNGLFADATRTDARDERILVNLSRRVFCSSQPIADHIGNIAAGADIDVVPNALNAALFRSTELDDQGFTPRTVAYVGAVSSWFDFGAVLQLLDAQPSLTVFLWGPCDVVVPEHERLVYGGILSHEAAIQAMRRSAVLLLPFRITDLIRAVDPVKVYEYIATGRPVVAADYPLLCHFGNWIYRYNSPGELIKQVEQHIDRPTLGHDRLEDFIGANNWLARAEKIVEKIE